MMGLNQSCSSGNERDIKMVYWDIVKKGIVGVRDRISIDANCLELLD